MDNLFLSHIQQRISLVEIFHYLFRSDKYLRVANELHWLLVKKKLLVSSRK